MIGSKLIFLEDSKFLTKVKDNIILSKKFRIINEVTQLHLLITKASVLLLHTVTIINNTELCSYTICKSDGAQPHQNNIRKCNIRIEESAQCEVLLQPQINLI